MQCACAVLSPVASPAVPYISAVSYKRQHFQMKVTEHKMCALIFLQLMSEAFLMLRRIHRDIVTDVQRLSCKVSIILVRF